MVTMPSMRKHVDAGELHPDVDYGLLEDLAKAEGWGSVFWLPPRSLPAKAFMTRVGRGLFWDPYHAVFEPGSFHSFGNHVDQAIYGFHQTRVGPRVFQAISENYLRTGLNAWRVGFDSYATSARNPDIVTEAINHFTWSENRHTSPFALNLPPGPYDEED
jgi:hypothetical protein